MPFAALPPLVLLPGTLCDERVFAPLLARLRQTFPQLDATVLLTTHCDTMRAAAELILAVAPQHFALLGFSLGGIIALEVALLAPERVLGMALLNVNAAPAPPHLHSQRREAVVQAQAVGHGHYVREQLWASYVAPAAQQDLALQGLIAAMAQDLGHTAYHHQTEAALARRDYRPLLSTLTMPTLVQAGERDLVCPSDAQHQLASAMPNAQFTLIPNAGHFALLEQQDTAATSVAAWFHDISDSSATTEPETM